MGASEETTLTERQRYWLEQVLACKASGKSIAEYATEHGIAAQSMYAGKKMLVKKGILPSPARFQRAQVVGVAIGGEWRIQLPNGVSEAFSGTVDARTLTTVLSSAATVE